MKARCVEPVEVTDLVTQLHTLAARLDPDAIADADVDAVMTDLGQASRLVQGMATLMARRVAEVRADRPSGPAEAVGLLADTAGMTQAEARRRLGTSTRLVHQPDVAGAVRDGRLSDAQTVAVADAVAADPSAEGGLLAAADCQSLADLRVTCRQTKAAADRDRDATRRRHLRARGCRSWHESDGEWKAMLSGPAEYGARFNAALRAEHDRVFRAAHATGEREPVAAYRIDALLAVMERGATPAEDETDNAAQAESAAGQVDGPIASAMTLATDRPDTTADPDTNVSGTTHTPDTTVDPDTTADGHGPDPPDKTDSSDRPGRPQRQRPRPRRRSGRETKVIITVDAAALTRGHLHPGDTCHIAGVGPVSLDAVRSVIPDAHIAYVIRDATNVAVAHLGRQASAHQRTAMEARGYECEVPDCRASHLLEIDHVRDWAFSRQTDLAELAWLCLRHHDRKTNQGHRLSGPPGRRRWHDQTGRILAQDAEPPSSKAAA